jgi:hypothetical protein
MYMGSFSSAIVISLYVSVCVCVCVCVFYSTGLNSGPHTG